MHANNKPNHKKAHYFNLHHIRFPVPNDHQPPQTVNKTLHYMQVLHIFAFQKAINSKAFESISYSSSLTFINRVMQPSLTSASSTFEECLFTTAMVVIV